MTKSEHPDHPDACFHGGAFFEAIGEELGNLDRRDRVINADVLDAWFPPAPSVLTALEDHLPWILRTSPPTRCEGLIRTIARVRGIPAECVLPGAGSSDLIFRALRTWLTPESRVLMLHPTYGEYAHLCNRIVGCSVESMPLIRADGYRVDSGRLAARLEERYDLVILVNPNNPTGQHIRRHELEAILSRLPSESRCWVDEAYTEYAGPDESVERFAVSTPNVIVCKSLSKVYGLSGARVAYLAAGERLVAGLRRLTPPWVVSLPAQVAAVYAMQAPDYYRARYRETHALRETLARGIRALGTGGEVITGVANWVLWHPPAERGRSAAEIARHCRARGLYVRQIEGGALRFAVKDAETQKRMIEILGESVT